MRIGPISLFVRHRCPHGKPTGVTLAALHWRNSITWRWVLTWKRENTLLPYGGSSTRTYKARSGLNGSFTMNLPVIGYFHLTLQPNKFQPGWKAYS